MFSVQNRAERIADRLALAALAAIALVALTTFRDYGLGWDDLTHAQYGDELLRLYASGFADRAAFSFVNLYMYGGGFDMLAALLHKVLPFGLFETRRLAGAAVGIIGLSITWRMARRVAGPLGGFIALVLLGLCPLYYGHMFMNPKDAPFAVAMALLLFGLVRALYEYPRPSPATVAFFGLGLGLTIGSRIIGGLAALSFAAALLLIVLSEGQTSRRTALRRAGGFVVALLPGIGLGYLVMGLVWPWSVVAALNPIRALGYFSHFFEKPWHEMFAGTLILVTEMPRSYVPTLLALKTPEILFALSLAGTVVAFTTVVRRDVAAPRRAVLLLLLVSAALPIVIAVMTRPAMYNGLRHFVFVTPPLAVLGGFGGARLFEALRKYGRAWLIGATAIFAAGLALPTAEFVRLHPYQYTYFNHLAGGIRGARGAYMLDYWGLSLKQASEGLRARAGEPPAGRPWRVAVCGPHPPAEVVLGSQFETTWDPVGADFAMMLGEFYCRQPSAPVVVEVAREGVIYARVYDIRKHPIDTLFTIPPVQ